MYTYKNMSRTTKTFYDTAFRPNETHEVPGYINDPEFVRVTSVEKPTVAKESTAADKKPSGTTTKVEKPATKASTSNNSVKKEDKSNG